MRRLLHAQGREHIRILPGLLCRQGRRHAVIAEMQWADDQTGCGEKQDIELFQAGCFHAFHLAYFGCKSRVHDPSREEPLSHTPFPSSARDWLLTL